MNVCYLASTQLLYQDSLVIKNNDAFKKLISNFSSPFFSGFTAHYFSEHRELVQNEKRFFAFFSKFNSSATSAIRLSLSFSLIFVGFLLELVLAEGLFIYD